MNTKTLISTILLSFSFYLLSFAQWELQYPVPTDRCLEDVCFVNDLLGWAVGENGTIIHTNDGGISWSFQNSGTTLRLRSVVFTDSQTGWIVGGETHPIPGDYIILHTSDGGNNWIEQASDSTTYLRSVFFFDSENGWAVGDNNYIFHTSDAGNNWACQESGSGFYNGHEVRFTDLMNGWIASSYGLYRTTDGGLNWNEHIPGSFKSVFFLDQNEGWASSNVSGYLSSSGILLHTNDAFNTWDTIYQYWAGEESSCGFYSIYFKDSDNGWMLSYDCYSGGWWGGCSYHLHNTEDGGSSWQYVELPVPISLDLNSLYYTQQGKGCIVGDHGLILSTSNWENQWEQNSEGNTGVFYSIDFPDNTNGWAVGSETYLTGWIGWGSTIVHTSDGGTTWDEQNSNISGPVQSVSFIDAYKGWAVGNSNDTAYIINTTNGGEEWLIQKWDTGYSLNEVCFLDESNGWVVGGYSDGYGNNEGKIFKTSNGGITWGQQDCDTCKSLYSVYFTDPDNGWIVGSSIYNTTDGGQNWTEQFYNTSGYTLESVFFTDTENGWAVGNKWSSGGILIHTSDGGSNWSSELFNTKLCSVYFHDHENGLISGLYGTILHTVNGGITWVQLDSGTENALFSVAYTSEGHGFAAGEWGTIIHSEDLITSIEKFPDKEMTYEMHCFSNPFSETTTLSYSLPQESWISIEIYNSKGQIVIKQKDEFKSEGKHDMVIDSKDIPSGIFFCVVKSELGFQTIKLIKH
ncbi:MAG: T9SS type A sorting domain-containing protein [Mariniphaga sp.]|nr:T9SS type A sorting domain-containing protein [Mariniphaga sp.]